MNKVSITITVKTEFGGGALGPAKNEIEVASLTFPHYMQEPGYCLADLSAMIMEWAARKQRSESQGFPHAS